MFEEAKGAIESINCQNINSENCQVFIDLIYLRRYSAEKRKGRENYTTE